MEKNKIRQIIADSISKPLAQILPRDIDIPLNAPKIISIIGHRRAGKTSVCYYLIKKLRENISPNRILYINFEDDRFFPIQLSDLDLILDVYYEMYPQNKDSQVYFFFDEIQEVPNWEKFIRRLFDTEKCRVYITGSSSNLLSREIATGLRGRTLSYEIFPLSFAEFLKFRNITPDFTSRSNAILQNSFDQYFIQGGFPELTDLSPELHQKTIKEYIDLMLFRDLAERFDIRNTYLLKYLLKYLLQNVSNLLSVNKVFNDLKSQGFSLSKSTVYEYISYFEEAFAIFRMNKWSTSLRQQAINPDKIYCIDHAYKNEMSISDDSGRILENIVFVHLKRKGLAPQYFSEKQEVDFYLDKELLMNVCFEMGSPATREREIVGLLGAMDFFDMDEGTIITRYAEEVIKEGSKTIFVKPITEYLLE